MTYRRIRKEETLIAYSRNGYDGKSWELPPHWRRVHHVTLFKITLDDPVEAGTAEVKHHSLTLSLGPAEALMIVPRK